MKIKFLDGTEKEIADLYGANLYGADLYGANLRSANLYGANLYGADLYGANLRGANLGGADLRGASLGGADLRGANLYGADLGGANLYGADLRGANLGGANLYGADLGGANLYGAKHLSTFNIAAQGVLTVWKKIAGDYIAELKIPAAAIRLNAYSSRKCRADSAKVVSIKNADGSASGVTKAASKHDNGFVYEVGKVVSVSNFCADPRIECAAGIHFFITREEAVDY
jgi:uncharacterized protein YjbI with pentapeptide repeats